MFPIAQRAPTHMAPAWVARRSWTGDQLEDAHIEAIFSRRFGEALLIEHEVERRDLPDLLLVMRHARRIERQLEQLEQLERAEK